MFYIQFRINIERRDSESEITLKTESISVLAQFTKVALITDCVSR